MTAPSNRAAHDARLTDPVPALGNFERMREGGAERRGYHWLDRNERVDPLPDWFVEEVRSRVGSDLLTEYPATDELHAELAAFLGIDSEQLLITPGNDPAIKSFFQAYARPGDRVAMLHPTYAMVDVYATMFGAEAVRVTYDADLEVDLEELVDAVGSSRIAVIANPNQPTGTILDHAQLRRILERAAETGTIVMVDEAYSIFAGTDAIPLLAEHPNLLVARSFSKAGFAGIRIGFLAGDPRVIGNMFKVRSAAEVNALAIACARLLVEHPGVMQDFAHAVEEGRRVVSDSAEALGLTPLPSHANFVQLRLNGRAEPQQVVAALRERGWLIKGPTPIPGLEDCVRVTLGGPELMAAFAFELAAVVDS